jgi:hypothetical protein
MVFFRCYNQTEQTTRTFDSIGRPGEQPGIATYYSLIESAKSARIDPFWFIQKILEKLPKVERHGNFNSLLPLKLKNSILH